MYRKTFSDFKKTLDNDIRTIIHKGKNVACYKFPWFQTILTFAEQGKTHIKKEQLSKPFVDKIIRHTRKSPFQGQTKVRDGKMLKSVKDHIDGKINMEELLLITEKEGFKDVVRALPIIGSKKITDDLYIDEMKANKRVILQDSFLELAQDKNLVKLLDAGTDSRWDLQQRVWEKKMHPSALISFDENNEMLFEERFNQRIYLTSTKPTLTNYQGDVCFYCRRPYSLNDLEVEHFIPLDLNKQFYLHKKKKLNYNLNNIGNLVNACQKCNGPKGKWHIYFPKKEFWYELHSRNEQMCNSEKPLELTLQSNLGKTTEQRLQKLIELRDLCFELYLKEWEGPIEIYGPLHYYKN